MPKRAFFAAALCLAATALSAQTTNNVVVANNIPTENTHAVTGVNIRALPDGTVWFMVPSNDRIVKLVGTTLTQWQIRDDKNIGANPVKFEFDGDVIWFICNGESLIDAGRSIFARLDTVTGALREFVMPGSKPAGFWRAPDGLVWIPQTDGRLQSLDMNTLQVLDYKSHSDDGKIFTFAISDIVYGPDGALWMVDFGNNRIVRYEPGAATETSWTYADYLTFRDNPSQLTFDPNGALWICERAAGVMHQFIPDANLLTAYSINTTLTSGTILTSPIHFELFQGKVYVTLADGSNGTVAVLDPALTPAVSNILTPAIVPVRHIVNAKPALIRDSVITPTTFESKNNGFAAADITVAPGPAGSGVQYTSFKNNNAYGITIVDGVLWVGSDGQIVRLQLQNNGADSDLAVPICFEQGAADLPMNNVDVTLANAGGSTISGNILFLFSPAAAPMSVPFTVNPNSTALVENAFEQAQPDGVYIAGSVRVQVTSGTASDLSASVRTVHKSEDGSNYGFSEVALDTFGGIGLGFQAALHSGGGDPGNATLGLYTSSAGAGAMFTATLFGSDGTVRGTRDFNLVNNTLEEFTPPAAAFGLSGQPGDVVLISGGPGSVRGYMRFHDPGSGDTAFEVAAKAVTDGVIPYVSGGLAADGTGPVSDLWIWNADPANAAHVTITYFPSVASSGTSRVVRPARRSNRVREAVRAQNQLTIQPGASAFIADVLASLFLVSPGSGTLVITSDVPVMSAVRLASRKAEGDYHTVVNAIDGSQSIPGGGSVVASGFSEIPMERSTDLVLFNRGPAASATVTGFDGNGTQVGVLTFALANGDSLRVPAILHQLGLDGPGSINNARLSVAAPAGSQIYAVAVQTDTVSGDMEWTRPSQ